MRSPPWRPARFPRQSSGVMKGIPRPVSTNLQEHASGSRGLALQLEGWRGTPEPLD